VVLVWGLSWEGVDVPAQAYRVEMFRQYGWLLVDSRWYSGHYLLPYSVLFPPFGAVVGLYGAAAISAILAAWAFDQLIGRVRGSLVASVVFALGTILPVAIGQFPFLSGEAVGLLALYATRTGRKTVAVIGAVCCPLLSPVAGVFLALAFAAAGLGGQRRYRSSLLGLAALSAAPIVVLNLAFVEPGTFPFWGDDFVIVLVLCVLGVLLVPRGCRALRLGILLYAGAAVVLFVVPNALGGNFVRLASAVAPALIVSWCWMPGHRRVLALLVVPVLLWQISPAWAAVASGSAGDASHGSYYQPLVEYLAEQPAPGRLEIPFTRGHWEAAFVAPHVSLARGWERQTDRADNPIFYRDRPISAASYQTWLYQAGVQWVALPDTALDDSALGEAKLLHRPPQYLRLVWRSEHWRVWQVVGSPGMVTGPASLVSVGPDRIVLQATGVGVATLRVRYTPAWNLTGDGCVFATTDGWTALAFATPGPVTLETSLFADHGTCPT
jgi:hypothetical protein